MRWPADTRQSQKVHALKHLGSIEFGIGVCKQRRLAVQAGGNVGLWPSRLAAEFKRVWTFEPEPVSRECLEENVAKYPNVWVRPVALGSVKGRCGIERRSLGSHRVTEFGETPMVPLDSFGFQDLDLLQLDIEGYEPEALKGGRETIRRCHPVIQVEILGQDAEDRIGSFMKAEGYRLAKDIGRDHVFVPG